MAGDRIVIDNDKILEAADLYEELAFSYDDLAEALDTAGQLRDSAFGGAMRDSWSVCYKLLYNCVYETAANLRAYSRTLKAIVEANELTESAIEQEFDELQDRLLGGDYERTGTQLEDGAAASELDTAPDAEILSMGGEYDASLDPDGTHGNRAV